MDSLPVPIVAVAAFPSERRSYGKGINTHLLLGEVRRILRMSSASSCANAADVTEKKWHSLAGSHDRGGVDGVSRLVMPSRCRLRLNFR